MVGPDEQILILIIQKANELSRIASQELSDVGIDGGALETAIGEMNAATSLAALQLNLNNDAIMKTAHAKLRLWRQM